MPNGPPPNKVIASQFDCPKHMFFEEYIALTHLPLEFRIQWQNTLVQLSFPVIDLKKVETTLFILQTIYQSGPRGTSGTYRESHEIISDDTFTRAFTEKIEDAMQSLDENWECAQALYSLICLTARVLTLSSNEGIRMTCLRLLADMGMISYSWKSTVNQMVIISPYEAQGLYPSIKESKHVTLHLYAPRSSLGLKPLDKLDLYNVSGEVTNALCIPRGFIIELNLFAGQLYLSSYEEYVEVCDFLGVAWQPMGEDSLVATDGFILRQDKNNRAERLESTFRQSPIKFLNFLMSQIRRKGEVIDKTHMGKMFNGIILDRSDFEEPRRVEKDQVLSD
ncbi:hypothetical protein BDV27DRAFT_161990 [Aspergillus caelatus]|uniref:Uncharacterized protein n=1 Tax=Aspergillus caelatus TaxID=61420 RepID=A0A5N6ZR20_9EURO|nr:uncharacterized protein BDV27DRAFT_161990 [Aspergillus caelatus]KAE8360087.1 hypothetical protein BDV27DRAFT_161990 [Aspergillus caelatus]